MQDEEVQAYSTQTKWDWDMCSCFSFAVAVTFFAMLCAQNQLGQLSFLSSTYGLKTTSTR